MRLSSYIFFIFALSIVGYMMGGSPAALRMVLGNQTSSNCNQIINGSVVTQPNCLQQGYMSWQSLITSFVSGILDSTNQSTGIITLLVGAFVSIGLVLSGFGALYIIPAIILVAVANFLIFPLTTGIGDPVTLGCIGGSYINATLPNGSVGLVCNGLGLDASLILSLILNLLLILSILSFVRGGDA